MDAEGREQRERDDALSLGHRLSRRLFPVAVGVGLLLSFGLPGTYYAFESASRHRAAATHAAELARAVQALVAESPTTWQYQTYEYREILQDFLSRKDVLAIRVRGEDGTLIQRFEYSAPDMEAWWNRQPPTATMPIHYDQRLMGSVEVGVSRATLVTGTLIVFLLSSTMGATAALVSYLLPVRVVHRMEEQMRGLVGDLRTAHAQTEQLLASISWIMVAVDENDRITQWNAAAEQAFGVSAADVLGQPLSACALPWESSAIVERFAQARGASRPTAFGEVRFQRRDGRPGLLTVTVNPITGDAGQRSGLLLLGSDISERKALEQQLAQAQKLESIGQLAAGVAHEINTPIQFVGDNVAFLADAFADLQRLGDAHRALRDAVVAGQAPAALLESVAAAEATADVAYLGEEIPRAFAQTLEGVTRVATIVRALKAFAHPDQATREPVDLNGAIENTLIVARNEFKYVADVELAFGQVPPVPGNPGELNQVFLNLIVNAAHAIGSVVERTGGKGSIRIETACEADMAVVVIRDTGGGIPEAIRDKIFDPFFTTKPVGQGSGQGLAIARSVVDKHGGSLTFETAMSEGTAFFVRLPFESHEPASAPDPVGEYVPEPVPVAVAAARSAAS
jgi:PAS domain S-box-containing protein